MRYSPLDASADYHGSRDLRPAAGSRMPLQVCVPMRPDTPDHNRPKRIAGLGAVPSENTIEPVFSL